MSKTRTPTVVLLSGGLDSAANLAFCHKWDEPILSITIHYGQRSAQQEIEAARKMSDVFGVPHQVLSLDWLGQLGGSSLTDQGLILPTLRKSDLDRSEVTRESAKSVWVPNRNGIFINVAASFAERLAATRIAVGFNKEEAATFPDNSTDYMKRATSALELSSSNHVEVFSYTHEWDKKQIVRQLKKHVPHFPFDAVWSCYEGGTVQCGICESCMRYQRAIA